MWLRLVAHSKGPSKKPIRISKRFVASAATTAQMLGKAFGPRETSSMHSPPSLRAWVEVNLAQLRRNFELINADKGDAVKFASVVKDEGYGHGAAAVSRVALEC